MKVKKGDTVKVLYGKDNGKTGKVLKVISSESKVIVDGLNVFKKHIKGDGRDKKSEIAEVVKPMHVAKVMVICSGCSKTTRVGYKTENDKKIRVCKNCGVSLDTLEKTVKNSKKTNLNTEDK